MRSVLLIFNLVTLYSNIENLVGQVRDIRLCLEMMPDGVLEYPPSPRLRRDRLECWSVGKNRRVPFFTDQIILRSKSILLPVFVHYSITPTLQYSILGFSKQSPFRGNSRPGPSPAYVRGCFMGLDSLLILIQNAFHAEGVFHGFRRIMIATKMIFVNKISVFSFNKS